MNQGAADAPAKLTLQIILAFIFGVIFISVILYLAINLKNLDPFARMVFLVVLSLAAGGVGAILPGFIIAGTPNKLVRAGGALAVFLVVLYFGSQYINPIPIVKPYKPDSDPSIAANKFASDLDGASYEDAYQLTSKVFKQGLNYYLFTELSNKILAKLGTTKARSMIFQQIIESPPGLPVGYYCYTNYAVDYSKSSVKVYQNVILVGEEESSDWRVFGIWFFVKDSEGNSLPIDFNSTLPL